MHIGAELNDIRRLTGANFLMASVGAAGEAAVTGPNKGLVMSLWRRNMFAVLEAVGWQGQDIAMRSFEGGVTLQISAPTDALGAACDCIEAAWATTFAQLTGAQLPAFDKQIVKLRAAITRERAPAAVALEQAALALGVTFLGHDEKVSLGLGIGAHVWEADALPAVDDVDWDQIFDIPLAMVTGTNGKSTTVRLAAAIGAAAGRCVGLSSSDWVRVGGEILDEGDYSGPAGARMAVRDPRVEVAIIETARGGLMRRGLPIPRADVCLLTNISADHLGGYGIMDVPALADAKFQIADAVRPGGQLVLNADDPELVARAAQFEGNITWFGLDMEATARDVWIAAHGRVAFVQDGQFMLARDGHAQPILSVADFAPAMGGAARFNVSNALGAIALADALDLPIKAMAAGLAGFSNSVDENPGRGNFIGLGGATLLIDFAHNPNGVRALGQAVGEMKATRKLYIMGQAGDRSDEDTREMTRAIWEAGPDHVVIKELPKKLRGRALGALSDVIEDELSTLGARPDQMQRAADELASVRAALGWAQPGDLLVLLLHEERAAAMELIAELEASHWQAGDPLP